jgi:hypothetical protein
LAVRAAADWDVPAAFRPEAAEATALGLGRIALAVRAGADCDVLMGRRPSDRTPPQA